MALWLKHVADG